ncbi:hypothetical protein COLO4_00325 [Corchorus olitorius]|uniref:Uncharacterized protein n=1 Tax=Corchorus olitorius TaxID=93759 RepID=A0A1R3KU23_9ROSI|nr:hypothetical protein COLO4_04449 [Corchorus olitorius]OMP14082.1 hypothetical protein COLO4_00325 [Corchorus olitorius]
MNQALIRVKRPQLPIRITRSHCCIPKRHTRIRLLPTKDRSILIRRPENRIL